MTGRRADPTASAGLGRESRRIRFTARPSLARREWFRGMTASRGGGSVDRSERGRSRACPAILVRDHRKTLLTPAMPIKELIPRCGCSDPHWTNDEIARRASGATCSVIAPPPALEDEVDVIVRLR
jgi:hypothetical protein